MKLVFIVLAILCSAPAQVVKTVDELGLALQQGVLPPVDAADPESALNQAFQYMVLSKISGLGDEETAHLRVARTLLTRTLFAAPEDPTGLMFSSFVALKLDDPAAAVGFAQTLARASSDFARDDWRFLRSVYDASPRPNDFRAFVVGLAQSEPSSASFRGQYELAMDDRRFVDARDWATAALALTDVKADKRERDVWHMLRGQAYHELGDEAASKADFEASGGLMRVEAACLTHYYAWDHIDATLERLVRTRGNLPRLTLNNRLAQF